MTTVPLFTQITGWVNPVNISILGQGSVVHNNLIGTACKTPAPFSATRKTECKVFAFITFIIVFKTRLTFPAVTGSTAVATRPPAGPASAPALTCAEVGVGE